MRLPESEIQFDIAYNFLTAIMESYRSYGKVTVEFVGELLEDEFMLSAEIGLSDIIIVNIDYRLHSRLDCRLLSAELLLVEYALPYTIRNIVAEWIRTFNGIEVNLDD